MPTMIQDNGVLDLKFRSGDDFAFDVTFPFAVTESQAQAAIGNLNARQSFRITSQGSTKIRLSLTKFQTAQLENAVPWELKVVYQGNLRTFIAGKYMKV